jgi:nucleotide-binding universal stress UspA family protein
MPMTAYKINRNQQEIIAQLNDAAHTGYKAFLKKHGLDKADIEFTTAVNDVFDIGHYIQETAFHTNTDLIIIGAKGHGLFEDFVFGSTTEKLVNKEVSLPILVVR